jgi:Tfp pilus assembly protein PilF
MLRAQAAEQAGRTDAAEQEYQRAVSSAGATAEMYVRYGQFQCKHGQLDAGLTSYEKALQMDRSTPGVMGLIGEVHVLQNRPGRAVEYLRKALQANPRETQTRLYLADALTRIGRAAEAVQILEAAPEDPDGRIHYVLGRSYMKQGDSERARKAMDVFRQRRAAVKR